MKKNIFINLFTVGFSLFGWTQYAPPAGEPGSTAIPKDDPMIVEWATEVIDFQRGLEDIAVPEGLLASFGDSTQALGAAEGTSVDVVSLGDNGSIVLTFSFSIRNEEGFDFAVFENSFSDDYLEFAHVEVSSNGERFVRIPSHSLIQTDTQTGTYGSSDATLVHNLAGKYRQGFGTPFDLEDIADSTGIDLNNVGFVRVVDVVGSINPLYGSRDAEGNLINDPYKTDFESGGFDLDAIGVIHSNNPALKVNEEVFSAVTVYPNPTNGAVLMRSNALIERITLFDLAGNTVLREGSITALNLNNYGLSKGIYVIEIADVDGHITRTRLVYH